MPEPLAPEHTEANTGLRHHLLDYTNLANQGTDALIAFLARLGQHRGIVPDIGGRVAAELLTHDDITQRSLADATGIPQSTIDRWIAPYRAGAA